MSHYGNNNIDINFFVKVIPYLSKTFFIFKFNKKILINFYNYIYYVLCFMHGRTHLYFILNISIKLNKLNNFIVTVKIMKIISYLKMHKILF